MDLLRWWNLIFLLPALAALLYLLLLATGAVAADGGEADLDTDANHDLAHGVEHVVGGHDAAGGEQHQPSGMLQVLSLVGLGRVPLSLLVTSFCFLWGFAGWVGNRVFGSVIESPAVFVWPSLAVALIGATALTRYLAIGMARLLPATESYGVYHRQLVGRLAEVRHAVTDRTGTAQLHDERGTLHEVPVRVQPGEEPIPPRSQVVLWRYDEASGTFLVARDQALEVASPGGAAERERGG